MADTAIVQAQPLKNLRILAWSQIIPWSLILLGTFVRLQHYLFNRSLWADEASIALKIVNDSVAAFLHPLAFSQAAPFGFLLIEKFSVLIFGNSEYSLRLFP